MIKGHFQIIISVFFLLLLSVISFSSSINNDFVNLDDDSNVYENPWIKELSFKNIKAMFTRTHAAGDYYPLVHLSYALEYARFRLNPRAYHTTNLILHLLNTLLVFWFIFLLSKRNVLISFISALFWGIHPLRVESVAWVAERKDVLYGLFFLGSLILYLYYGLTKKRYLYILSFIVFILSLLSKSVAVTLPIGLILCDYLLLEKMDKRTLLNKIPYFTLSLVLGIFVIFTRFKSGDTSIGRLLLFWDNLLIALKSLVFYLQKTLFPLNLSAVYPYPENVSIFYAEFLLPIVVVLSLSILVFYSRRYTKKIMFGSLFFVFLILPMLKLLPFNITYVATNYTYIPSIGLSYLVGEGLYWLSQRRIRYQKLLQVSLFIILFVFVGTFFLLTSQGCKVWKSSQTLWKDVIQKSPSAVIAYNNLGLEYSLDDYEEAVRLYKRAIELKPDYEQPYYNLGLTYDRLDRYEEAIKYYQKAIELKPNYAEAYNNLGIVVYKKLGQYNEAIKLYKKAIEFKPDYAQAYNNLAVVLYTELGQGDEAMKLYKKAIEFNPEYAEAYYNLGLIYDSSGLYEKAAQYYQKAIELNPDSIDAYNNLGAVYRDLDRYDKAIEYLKKAIELKPDYLLAHKNLALTYYGRRLFSLARSHWERVLEIDPENIVAQENLARLKEMGY